MEYEIFGYSNALEIIQHPNYVMVLNEITAIIESCPIFAFKGKSTKNDNLEVSQIFINKYLDYKFSVESDWDYHPEIVDDSGLSADFRKSFNEKHFQIEVQFGNMARWYSDIFKFQIANIYNYTDIGICIVPMTRLAGMVGSNVANFERCTRELPHIRHLLHLPLLIIGVDLDRENYVDLWQTNFPTVVENRHLLDNFDILSLTQRSTLAGVYKHLTKPERSRKIIFGTINGLDMNTIDDDTEMIDVPQRNAINTDDE